MMGTGFAWILLHATWLYYQGLGHVKMGVAPVIESISFIKRWAILLVPYSQDDEVAETERVDSRQG